MRANRLLAICLAVFLTAGLTGNIAGAAPAAGAVSTSPPMAALKNPARLDVVTFNMFYDGENHKMIVTLGAALVRLDAIEDRYSIIYDPSGEEYIGLEHSNDTYWRFSWPAVEAKVAQSKRYEAHMRDLLLQGINPDGSFGASSAPSTDGTNAGSATSSAGADTDSGAYIWQQTTEHRKIAGLDCVRWTGQSTANPGVEAWCCSAPVPAVRAAMEKIRVMNEPMALVPVRTLVPAFLFTVYDSLVKGGETPLLVTWGGDLEKNKFSLAEAASCENKPTLFSIPKLYIKTTLVTMDGITNPVGGGN